MSFKIRHPTFWVSVAGVFEKKIFDGVFVNKILAIIIKIIGVQPLKSRQLVTILHTNPLTNSVLLARSLIQREDCMLYIGISPILFDADQLLAVTMRSQ